MPRLAFQNSLALQAAPSMAIDWRDRRQPWEGFWASEPFLGAASDASMDLLFDATSGIGLSGMRVGIETDGGTMGTWSNVTKAVARGAKIIALPWSAPGAMKDSGIVNGGHLLAANYAAWSDTLAAFQATMIGNTSGVTGLYGLSLQSEPDFQDGTFAQMPFTTAEYVSFWKVLAPKLAALNPRPKMIAGDTAGWSTAWTYTDAVLADSVAAPYVDRAGGHQYSGMGASTGNWTGLKWMTESSTFDAYDGTIVNGLVIAAQIHEAIVTGGASAWMWWWMVRSNQSDNQGLIDTVKGNPKRYYVLGNYSKFVRPGYIRVGTTGTVSGVSMSAFLNPSTGDYAVVVINSNGSATQFTASMAGLVSHTVTPWITDATRDLAAQTAVPVSNGVFTLQLPASSVTSFVGSGS